MYLRIRRGRFDPATYDELMRLWWEAGLVRLPGFERLQVGTDRTAGTLIAVSTWDTQVQASVGFDAIADAVADRAQVLGVQLDPPEIFEIAAQHAAMV
jgi:hypothetical protein